MDTYVKLTSVKNNSNCNCITPFYLNNIIGTNPITKREYSNEDMDAMKTSLYRISAAKGCDVSVCCDINDPTTNPDNNFTKQFIRQYPKIMPLYEGSNIIGIKLSTDANVKESGWQDPTPYMICKITKATISDTKNPTVKLASNLVKDCYSNNCSALETITINTLLQNAKSDMKYTYFDDARVSQAILENNISYVKEYIRKYKQINISLTNDDYNNRLIHLAAGTPKHTEILTMLIALKANLNITNKFRETPLHFAVRGKNIDNINALLVQGVDVSITNNDGETAMFYAMKTGDLRIINMLYNNNSPLQGIDNSGNNLIHYCVLYCPSYKEDDETIPNSKGEIIQFLIERGISTLQKNNAGITPLELVSKQINKEINKECKDNITEAFVSNTVINNNNNNKHAKQVKDKVKEQFKNSVTTQNTDSYTTEHISLLDIQTKLFNNILRNNPSKYNDYISVADIPLGAPIEVLDTVCVRGAGSSNMLTGNEDSDECIAKGGQIVKIKNITTKIKLELIPEEDSSIANIKQDELYYPKDNKPIPKGTIPNNILNYNLSVKDGSVITPQTTGITYTLGQSSNNTIPTKQHNNDNNDNINTTTQKTFTIDTKTTTPELNITEHPAIIEEDSEIVHKCKKEAFNNAINNTKTTTQNNNNDNNNGKLFLHKYKTYIIIILCLILLFLFIKL